jgi:5,6,7,8-tetrahydromethanopterin hydro-lyase
VSAQDGGSLGGVGADLDGLHGLDGRIGEGWSGEVPNGSHINLVLARRGSATAAAAVGALAAPRPGILPFLACLSPGKLVRPATIVVNKVSVEDPTVQRVTWGAAQLGIAQGVLDAVADRVLDPASVDDLLILVAVWVDPAAHDDRAVKRANREATRAAIADALRARTASAVEALVAAREDAANGYYPGD